MLQGAGLGYRRDLADDFLNLSSNNAIQFMEVAPENWVKMGGAARYKFDQAAERYPLAVHGLSLSLGGQAPLDRELLKNTKALMTQYNSTFFSEHLSYCECEGHLYDLLPMPFTEEAVKHVAQRIRYVQDFLGLQISLENTSYYLHSPTSTMNEVEFLNAIAQEADCGIHLDVNNIYVNGVNHGLLDPYIFLDQVDVKRVNYIHIAGHDEEHSAAQVVEDLEGESFNKIKGAYRHLPELLIDTHGEAVKGTVWDLLEYAYQRLPVIPPTLLERDFNFPPFAELYAEVEHIAQLQQKYAQKEVISYAA
ncbi:HvfB family MNIO-type RiPP peptide maturase [Haemophilus parahaemolyticus]